MMHACVRRVCAVALAGAMACAPAFERSAAADEPSLAAGIARIRVEISRTHVVVVHDVNLARSAPGEDLEAFVAFGAPGAPRAFEAWLVPIAAGALEAAAGERGVPLTWSYAKRRPASAIPLLGRATMAGVVVPLGAAALARAFAPSGVAALRLRALEALPAAAEDGSRELVVRLGERVGAPLLLGRIEVATAETDWLERVEARLCTPARGTMGDRVSVRVVAPGAAARAKDDPSSASVAPVLATRKSGEDLCVRLYTSQKSGSAVAAPES